MAMLKVEDAALDWAVRAADADFADWDVFTVWLKADPAHAAHYDAAVAALASAEQMVAAVPAPGEPTELPKRRMGAGRRWFGAAIAAAVVGAIGVGVGIERPRPYSIETAAGQQRTVNLPDGSRIMLAGGSRVELDRNKPRYAAVARGEMLFRVRHDDARPFHVRAGNLNLTDLGTEFDVKRSAATVRVAVAEGAVMVDPDGAAVRLDPGQAVIVTGTRIERRQVEAVTVGGWRDGRLAYDDATMAEVAEDLSRHLGRPVTAAPAVARLSFRGTLDVRRLAGEPRLLGALLGVRVRQHDGGWTLEPRQ